MDFNIREYSRNFPGVVVEPETAFSLEAKLLREACTLLGWSFRVANNGNRELGAIPCGSVDWTREYMKQYGIDPPIDPYPEFLHHLLYRHVWFSEKWPHAVRCFIKPARREKHFNGFVKFANSYVGKKHKESYWCSTIVEFGREMRCYVANSQILSCFYEPPSRENDHVPESFDVNDLPTITFPNDTWCGTIDFGFLKTGEIALVEAHQNPFACGWYGETVLRRGGSWSVYAEWLQKSWETMLLLANK